MKLSERKRKDLRPTPAGDCVYFWLDDIEELEKLETQFEAELKAVKNDYERIKQLEAELEQWRAEHQDETDPKIRPMTRMENAWMDAEGKIGSLEAENAAAFELLDVYEKENERLRAVGERLRGYTASYSMTTYSKTAADAVDEWDALKEGE